MKLIYYMIILLILNLGMKNIKNQDNSVDNDYEDFEKLQKEIIQNFEDEINLLYDYSEDTNTDDWLEENKKSHIEGKNNINENNIDIYINDKKIKFNYKYNRIRKRS